MDMGHALLPLLHQQKGDGAKKISRVILVQKLAQVKAVYYNYTLFFRIMISTWSCNDFFDMIAAHKSHPSNSLSDG